MNTSSSPEAGRRLPTLIAATMCVATLGGLGAFGLTRRANDDLPASASPFRCRRDAAQRWQVPQIAPADLPHTADAAEAWLTPEIAIADLPHTADAMERWLCAP